MLAANPYMLDTAVLYSIMNFVHADVSSTRLRAIKYYKISWRESVHAICDIFNSLHKCCTITDILH